MADRGTAGAGLLKPVSPVRSFNKILFAVGLIKKRSAASLRTSNREHCETVQPQLVHLLAAACEARPVRAVTVARRGNAFALAGGQTTPPRARAVRSISKVAKQGDKAAIAAVSARIDQHAWFSSVSGDHFRASRGERELERRAASAF